MNTQENITDLKRLYEAESDEDVMLSIQNLINVFKDKLNEERKSDHKKTISSAISHLNGYVLILEKQRFIGALAVKDCIKELKLIKEEKK